MQFKLPVSVFHSVAVNGAVNSIPDMLSTPPVESTVSQSFLWQGQVSIQFYLF